jgi:uncharacterized protein involved in exopolysaccharide biosynthesis
MNHSQTTGTGSDHSKRLTGEVDLIDALIVLARHKRLVFGLPLITGVIAAIISLCLPSIYSASTKMLPPQQAQSGAAALLSQLGGVAGLAAGAAGIKNPNELYVGMLKSRTIADSLIERFSLRSVYDAKLAEDARLALEANTTISSGKDGMITVTVEDKDRIRVSALANAYVEELSKLTKKMALTEAAQRRVFFEGQLEQAKNNLAAAELKLKKALETHGVTSVDSDSRAVVEVAARLRAQISAKEIQLNSISAFVTPNNPEYRRAQEELNSLRAESVKLENGRGGRLLSNDGTEPQSGLENIKVLRDVKYYQMLYELLAKQYEAARLDEAKDPSIVQVLDRAAEPERRAKPKRTVIVLMTSAMSFFVAIGLAFFAETKRRMLSEPEAAAKWNRLTSLLRLKN